MADYATQKAQSMDNLSLDDLVAAVQAKGQSEHTLRWAATAMIRLSLLIIDDPLLAESVPKQVQTQLLEKIRDFLDRNVEDA